MFKVPEQETVVVIPSFRKKLKHFSACNCKQGFLAYSSSLIMCVDCNFLIEHIEIYITFLDAIEKIGDNLLASQMDLNSVDLIFNTYDFKEKQ